MGPKEGGKVDDTARQCSGCMISKGNENASRIQSERPIGGSEVEGGKGRWWEVSRTAREAWLYLMESAHGPNKSSESPSEPPFPALEASISGCGSTLTHIPSTTFLLLSWCCFL